MFLLLYCLSIFYQVTVFYYGVTAALPIEANCNGQSAACVTPSLCQEGWTYAVRRCYNTVSTLASYREAHSMCRLQKGYLPVVTNDDQHNYLSSAETSVSKWIGLDDLVSEGAFMWHDELKSSTTYTRWGVSEPSNYNGEEHCVEISGGYWNDLICTASRYTICEMDLTPRKWYPRGHSMYLFNTITQNWLLARDSCEDVGAHLAVIGDYAEHDWIRTMGAGIKSGGYSWLIGINDYSSEGTYVWPDSGEQSTYTYWYPGEPNDAGNEDAIVISYSYHQWVDVYTSRTFPSVCEKGIEWEYYNGKKYFATDYRMTANDGINVCADIGGYLAVITSSEENTFLVNMIEKSHYQRRGFYIGMVSDSNGIWSWRDSTEPVYSNWAEDRGQMTSACATLSLVEGQWFDNACTEQVGILCEAEIPWTPWHDEKYYINTTPMTYDRARETCQQLGGDLVSYDTVEEEIVLDNLVRRTSILTSKYKKIFIGSRKEDDVFKWARTGTTSTFSNWCPGNPSGDGNCVEYISDSYCYNDVSCSVFKASICEADLHPTDGILWEQRRYFVNKHALRFESASAACNEMGMELATITSNYEMSLAMDLIDAVHLSSYNIYIGYNDIDTEGTYVWKSETQSRATTTDFELFSSSATLNEDNDCTSIYGSSWNTFPCVNSYHHICELGIEDDYVFTSSETREVENLDPQNTCVQGHTLQDIKVRSLIECTAACANDVGCVSVNYYTNLLTDDVMNCQLNNVFRSDNPDDVFVLSTCSYYEIK
ncbi:macrophage mannose receptor 1-like [Antedon mediterranea]|uniref:macrophage mannose receptor 1-like n=1 Tax=Antedon mediterranea TaxID=105859 RepID=UPI003AF57720